MKTSKLCITLGIINLLGCAVVAFFCFTTTISIISTLQQTFLPAQGYSCIPGIVNSTVWTLGVFWMYGVVPSAILFGLGFLLNKEQQNKQQDVDLSWLAKKMEASTNGPT